MRFGIDIEEDSYFKVNSSPVPKPVPGVILIERLPHSDRIRLTYPDGQTFLTSPYDAGYDLFMRRAGLSRDPEKLERVINYVWSFRTAYLAVEGISSPPKELLDALQREKNLIKK